MLCIVGRKAHATERRMIMAEIKMCKKCGKIASWNSYFNGYMCECGNIERKTITNADRIRAMNDEELANFLHNVVCKFMCEYCKEYERIKAAKGHEKCNGECDKAYLEWLKQPAE